MDGSGGDVINLLKRGQGRHRSGSRSRRRSWSGCASNSELDQADRTDRVDRTDGGRKRISSTIGASSGFTTEASPSRPSPGQVGRASRHWLHHTARDSRPIRANGGTKLVATDVRLHAMLWIDPGDDPPQEAAQQFENLCLPERLHAGDPVCRTGHILEATGQA